MKILSSRRAVVVVLALIVLSVIGVAYYVMAVAGYGATRQLAIFASDEQTNRVSFSEST